MFATALHYIVAAVRVLRGRDECYAACLPASDLEILLEDEPERSCGWFDSSHDLRRGLQVTEHACADAVAGQLPLADWIALHLTGWQPAQRL